MVSVYLWNISHQRGSGLPNAPGIRIAGVPACKATQSLIFCSERCSLSTRDARIAGVPACKAAELLIFSRPPASFDTGRVESYPGVLAEMRSIFVGWIRRPRLQSEVLGWN